MWYTRAIWYIWWGPHLRFSESFRETAMSARRPVLMTDVVVATGRERGKIVARPLEESFSPRCARLV